MSLAAEKIKVSNLAHDLGIKTKDVVALFPDTPDPKKLTVLSVEEAEYVINTVSADYQVEDIDKYISGEIDLGLPDISPKEAEKKEETSKEEASKEEASSEESPKAEKTEEPKNSQNITEGKKETAPKKEEKKPVEAEKKPAVSKPAFSKEKDKKKPAVARTYQTIERNSNIGFEDVRREVKVVDTRVVDVDLSKYDDKLLQYVSDSRYAAGGKQKFGNGGRNQRNNKFDKKKKGAQDFKRQEQEKPKPPEKITIPQELQVSQLAKELRVTTAQVVKKLIGLGVMANLNSIIDFDTAVIVADEFGTKAEPIVEVTIEEKLIDESADDSENLVERPPIVVVMGHVDHGKTSILDAIRHTSVTSGEAGGITQHIGAYQVTVNGKTITFLDTPGHAAFTAMRARGAGVTDIAILVVAADDGIMPQTVEAINHAKAAGVSIIVAINKMDKPGANPETVKQELTKYDLVPEEWGGDVICVPVSALTGQGLDNLLESVLLVAEVGELKANPNRHAKGVVIEAKLDKGRGPVATVLVQNGTLHAGDIIIAGTSVGRVRAMTNDLGKRIKEAGPSTPVEILGLSEVPDAGDIVNAVDDERMARELAAQRTHQKKEDTFKANAKVSLDALFSQIKDGIKDLNVIIKADVQGSAEAVRSSLEKLSNEEVRVRVIHAGVGGITENDVMLASASNAIIVGFNVRPDRNAVDSAEKQSVDIRTYRIIYECIEEITTAMKGMLAPKFKEVVTGQAEVRQLIRVPAVGTIAGSYVIDGKIVRNASIRVIRDGIVVSEDKLQSLKRFKDDAKEVNQGYECGIGLEKFNDIKEGDILEAFIMEEIKN